MQMAGIAALLLCGCLALTLYFQKNAKNIAEYSLPSALSATRLANGIEQSGSILRSWVLLGNATRLEQRRTIWLEQIEPALEELEHYDYKLPAQHRVELRSLTQRLKDSQWWVEDMAAAMGNNPARLLYELELLPMFNDVQRSLIGLQWNSMYEKNVSAIQFAAAESQRNLSEAIRQLSEAVRTGGVAEIDEFRKESELVRLHLTKLENDSTATTETKSLLNWIIREYSAYESLANEIIAIRESEDWNRALYALRTETEPLALEVKNALIERQRVHNTMLHEDVARSAFISRVSSFLMWSFIAGLALAAWFVAKRHASRLATPIMALAKASDQLVEGTDIPQKIQVEGPREIKHLLERFNYMRGQLTSRNKALKNANSELQEYTHIITHDLKAPLINIRGHAGLIKNQLDKLESVAMDSEISDHVVREQLMGQLADEIPESIKYIDLSISKTSTLVNGVLNKSRLLFRTNSIEPVDTNELIGQVTAQFSHRFQGVAFKHSQLPVIRADRFLLEYSFSNLIDNALKYLDSERAGEIEVGGEILLDEARFYVKDNGKGLVDTSVDIFKLFVQENHTNTGTGVGLALVKTMLEKMGGSIWYEANEDYGTTFYFSIPQQQEDIPSNAPIHVE